MAVEGIGGLFFRAKDPDALKLWYLRNLASGGGGGDNGDGDAFIHYPAPLPMMFVPFKADSDYFADDKAFMLNMRVSDLDATCDRLRADGIEVITKDEWNAYPEMGRFARIHDPEGNAIELWEPPAEG